MARCVTIGEAVERLQCYDAVTAGRREPEISEATEDTGKWEVHISNNSIDDTEQVVLALSAENDRNASMIARCRSNETELYVVWDEYLGDDGLGDSYKNMTVRLGKNKAMRQQWGLSTDSKATFAPSWAGNLLKDIIKVDTVLLQTIPYNESPKTLEFDVRGLQKTIVPLAKTCKWATQ